MRNYQRALAKSELPPQHLPTVAVVDPMFEALSSDNLMNLLCSRGNIKQNEFLNSLICFCPKSNDFCSATEIEIAVNIPKSHD